jgi:uncharacterized membrane protein YhiD involved in acid resistance
VLQIDFLRGYEPDLLIDFGLVLLAGFLIGAERESRGKPAGRRMFRSHKMVACCV